MAEDKKQKWRRGKIAANRASDSTSIPGVKALIYGDTGLAVNPFPPKKGGRYLNVTHIGTGMRIGPEFKSPAQAKLGCVALAMLTNWNGLDKSNLTTELGNRVRLARKCIDAYGKDWRPYFVAMRLGVEAP